MTIDGVDDAGYDGARKPLIVFVKASEDELAGLDTIEAGVSNAPSGWKAVPVPIFRAVCLDPAGDGWSGPARSVAAGSAEALAEADASAHVDETGHFPVTVYGQARRDPRALHHSRRADPAARGALRPRRLGGDLDGGVAVDGGGQHGHQPVEDDRQAQHASPIRSASTSGTTRPRSVSTRPTADGRLRAVDVDAVPVGGAHRRHPEGQHGVVVGQAHGGHPGRGPRWPVVVLSGAGAGVPTT